MATATTTRSRADQFTELNDLAPQDIDPEDDVPEFSESDGSDPDIAKATNGRGHYAGVEKSKLRRRDLATLGPRYTGSRVSRTDLIAGDDDHDPFADYESDVESASENAFENGQAQGKDGSSDESEMLDEDESDGDDGVDRGMLSDNTSVDDEDHEEEEDGDLDDMEPDDARQNATDRAQLRQIMNQDRGTVAASIAQASKADAEKGMAVKKQRQTFDAVLNGRIRLQQGLVAINSLQERDSRRQPPTDFSEAYAAAEQAAVQLWNTIETLKKTLDGARAGFKRKHHEMAVKTPLSNAWTWMQEYEADSRAHRRSVLQKWSAKTQGATIQPASRKLIGGPRQTTILNVLDEHLSNKDRLVKRTRMPRSCAPAQASAGITDAPGIFDDADFYGVLLKELLEQRSIDSGGVATDMAMSQWQAAREAKVKKKVDTKASKGRKLRYTVHEKLQNFMAPEDRRTWTERQIDELFGNLLGRRLALGDADDGEAMEGGDAEEEALKLFRS